MTSFHTASSDKWKVLADEKLSFASSSSSFSLWCARIVVVAIDWCCAVISFLFDFDFEMWRERKKNAKRFIGFFSNFYVCIMRKHLNTFNVCDCVRVCARTTCARVCDAARSEKWEYYFIVWAFSAAQSEQYAFAESRIYCFSLFFFRDEIPNFQR